MTTIPEINRFLFSDIDGRGTDIAIFAIIDCPEEASKRKELHSQIEDAISSYCDTVSDWQYEELIDDVLNSLGVRYQYADINTFFI